jgi:putative phosphoesterase
MNATSDTIGIISDVHANLPALNAVLDDMPDVDRLICLGDVVGYNPWPAECVERVCEACDVVLQGNHDRVVETPDRYALNEMAHEGLLHALGELSDDQREWLESLPPRCELDEMGFLAAHSHPDPEKTDTYVMPSDFSRMNQYLEEYDGLLLGHTHVQHQERVDGRLVVNPGSVGQPRDEDPRAAYTVYDTAGDDMSLHRVRYPVDHVAHRIAELGLPRRTGDRLHDGM